MATPVGHASNLSALLVFYQQTLGFTLMHEIPGVVALLSLGPARLQLWQRAGLQPRACRLVLPTTGAVFELHAHIARRAPASMAEVGPVLQCWGEWEFIVHDCQGNRLHFCEPAAGPAQTRNVLGQT